MPANEQQKHPYPIRTHWPSLVVSLLAVYLVASTAGIYGVGEWYRDLNKPWFTPPDWVFSPAWITLYTLMAIAAWLVWLEKGRQNIVPAIAVYAAQLLFNALWTFFFFGLHQIDLALVHMLMLIFLVALSTVLFWRIRLLPGLLLAPYLLWLFYAAALNYGIWRINE